MDLLLQFKVNSHLYLRDPEGTSLGKQIVRNSIDLIDELGFEQFTFRKLAKEIGTTEATVYRYFENKHRLLLYILNWYWSYVEYLLVVHLKGIDDPKEKLIKVLAILSDHLPTEYGEIAFEKKKLIQIVIKESSKSYLVKDVQAINKEQAFKPYKELCDQIAQLIVQIKPSYRYPHSLASTLIESAHHQTYFSLYLPKLTDYSTHQGSSYTFGFLSNLVSSVLDFE
jgi:AcrR family transcriptional regulator